MSLRAAAAALLPAGHQQEPPAAAPHAGMHGREERSLPAQGQPELLVPEVVSGASDAPAADGSSAGAAASDHHALHALNGLG